MVDLHYSDPSLVNVYDGFNAEGHILQFYQEMIGPAPKRVVDLGCGTGRFAVLLASSGHQVTGVDPATRMLDFARARPGGKAVEWIEGDATALSGMKADVVVMTGHAFQCLLTDEAVSATFSAVRSALATGGRFMFESRNPLDQPWRRWTPDASVHSTTDNKGHTVSARHTVLACDGEFVTFVTDYELHSCSLQSRSTLRFMSREAIEQSLRDNGFSDIILHGDWRGSPFATSSRETIVLAA